MDTQTERRYRAWRGHGFTAKNALEYVREERRMAEVLERFGEWKHAYGTNLAADLLDAPTGATIRVLVGDDDIPTEWGDTEPTEEEREHAESFYVAVLVLDTDGEELYHDGIGGVDVIDLPGYLQRDWEDAAAYALLYYLLDGALEFTRRFAHRSYSLARG